MTGSTVPWFTSMAKKEYMRCASLRTAHASFSDAGVFWATRASADQVGDRSGVVGSPHQGDVFLQFGDPGDHVRPLGQLAAVVAVAGLGGGRQPVRAPGPGLGERLLTRIDESWHGKALRSEDYNMQCHLHTVKPVAAKSPNRSGPVGALRPAAT